MKNVWEQLDEMEALQSIYGAAYRREYINCTYSIEIAPALKLFVTLVPDYPSQCPPKYELFAPELSGEQKTKIHKDFKNIFERNIGSTVVFQWVEKLKDIAYANSKPSKLVRRKIAVDKDGPKNNTVQWSKKIVHGPVIEDRKSVFQGHACEVHSEEDVRSVLDYLKKNKKIAQASHNVYAYMISRKPIPLQGCSDDGENAAGKRILHFLECVKQTNLMVVVTRWRGLAELGADRFRHYTSAARQALVEAKMINK